MPDFYCVYEGPVEREGGLHGGAVNLRTREGFAIAVFATEAMARWFVERFQLGQGPVPRTVIPFSALGTAEYPRRASKGRPQPFKKIVFPSQEVLEAWASDREGFATAAFVSKL